MNSITNLNPPAKLMRCAAVFVGAVIASSAPAFAATQAMYPNVAGSYDGFETYTMDVTDNYLGHKVFSGSGGGTIVLSQSGNRITYKAIDPLSGKPVITRTGTLTGNDVSISGPAAVAPSGIALTKNVFTGTGTVEDGRIVIRGTATIVARRGSQVETILVTSTATLTGDVTPANVGRIQASAWPSNGGSIAGVAGNGVYPAGTAISLTANRAPGYYLIGWTEGDTVISTDPKLSLTVEGSRSLRANFGAVGAASFAGLFQSGPDSSIRTVGYLGATLTSTSAFSGTLRVLGGSHSLSGAFDAGWNYQRSIARAGRASLIVSLHLDPATRTLTGTIKTADEAFSAAVFLVPAPAYSRLSPTPHAGLFNVLLPPEAGTANPVTPQGTGYLSLKISNTGAVTAAGKLADGTAVSLSSQIGDGLAIPLHKFLYAKSADLYGGLYGTLSLHGNGGADDACDGELRAEKPAQTGSGFYTGGFEVAFAAEGERYSPPAAGTPVLNATAVVLSDGGIDLLQPITQAITVSPANAVTALPPNTAKIRLSITPGTGAFSGTFVHPVSLKSTVFSGLICRGPNMARGAGFFQAPNAGGSGISGNVVLSP